MPPLPTGPGEPDIQWNRLQVAFLAAVVPIVLFVRSVLFRRPTRFSQGMKEFKQQVDLAVSIFLAIVAVIV
jgi:hypothetical protein